MKLDRSDVLLTTIVVLLLLAIILVSIVLMQADGPRTSLRLQDGSVIECKNVVRVMCGVNASDCSDGRAYVCQHNVTVIRGSL